MYYPYNPRHINALLLLYNQYFLDIFLRMSRFYLFFLQKISFSMVNLKEVSSFCWDHLLAIFSGDRCMVFWIDWLHWFIRRRSHIFSNSCRNTLLSIKRIFTGWMNESSTHRTHSLGVFSDLLISVCRFNVHCFFPDNGTFTLNSRSSQFRNQIRVKHLSEWASESVIFTAHIIKPVADDEEKCNGNLLAF